MMHRDNCVVTVRSNGKPLREFDHSKVDNSTTALLPFDSEYQIGVKVLDSLRRRIEVTIDGSEVIHSLVLRQGDNLLERFQDVERCFKFVRPFSEGVQDPTSPDNGKIVIKIWKEMFEIPQRMYLHQPISYGYAHRQHSGYPILRSFGEPTLISGGHISTGSIQAKDIQCSSITADKLTVGTLCCATAGEVGATVEGSKSDQKFSSTTWRGDMGAPTVFEIRLRGRAEEPRPLKQTLCVQCSTPNDMDARFCKECGLRIRI